MDTCQRGRYKLWIAALVASLAFGLAAETASAFIDLPVLVPENPIAGQTVSVSIRHGECDGFRAKPSQVTQVGNAVHMLLESSHYDDIVLCNDPIFTAIFTVGAFPVGTYTLHVERVYDTGVPAPVYETLANFEFTVRGEGAVALPATGALGALLLIAGILIAVARKHRAGHASASVLFLISLLVSPSVTRTQEQEPHAVEVLLSNASGAPTPEDVVQWVSRFPGEDPPLQAFSVVGLIGVNYLL